MYIDERERNGATVLELCGRFDESDHDRFMEAIENLHNRGCHHVVVNLSSLYFLDPAVVNLLHFAHEYFQATSKEFALVSPVSTVRNELNLAKVSRTIPIYDSVYDAFHRPHSGASKPHTTLMA